VLQTTVVALTRDNEGHVHLYGWGKNYLGMFGIGEDLNDEILTRPMDITKA